MELLNFFNDDSVVIGLCDLGRRTPILKKCYSIQQEPVIVISGNMKKVVSAAVNPTIKKNFFAAAR